MSRIRKRDAWFFAGEYERIVQELRPATTVVKSREQSYYGAEAFEYAYTLCASGSWQAGVEWCERIIASNNRPSTHEHLCAGLAHMGLGNIGEARQFFMDAAKKRLYTFNAGYEGWFALYIGIVCFGMKAIDWKHPITKQQVNWDMSCSPEPFLISQLLLRQKPLAELEAAAIQKFKKPRTPDGVLWRLRFYREIQKFEDGEIAGSLLSRRISALAKEQVPYIFFDFVIARAFNQLPRLWVKK